MLQCTIVPVDNLWITHQYTDDQYTDNHARIVPGLFETGGGSRLAEKFLLEPIPFTKEEK